MSRRSQDTLGAQGCTPHLRGEWALPECRKTGQLHRQAIQLLCTDSVRQPVVSPGAITETGIDQILALGSSSLGSDDAQAEMTLSATSEKRDQVVKASEDF